MAKGAAALAAMGSGAGAGAGAAGAATAAPAVTGALGAGVGGAGAGSAAGLASSAMAAPTVAGAAGAAAPAAAAAAPAAGGLGAWMMSPTGQAVTSLASGVLSAASPEAARGIAGARGTFGMLESMKDRDSVAGAVSKYSNVVNEDLAQRGIDQVVREGGHTGPQQAGNIPGGPFVMGGAASGPSPDVPSSVLESYGAEVGALPAIARANPSQAGYLMADIARRRPDRPAPAGPTLTETVDRFGSMQAGLPPGVGMQQTHTGPHGIKTVLQARQPAETVDEKEEGLTEEEFAALRASMEAGDTAKVTGPYGAERSLKGPRQPGGPVAQALPFAAPQGSKGWVLDERTGKWQEPPPGYGEEAANYVVVEDPSAPGGFRIVPTSSRR